MVIFLFEHIRSLMILIILIEALAVDFQVSSLHCSSTGVNTNTSFGASQEVLVGFFVP